MYPSVLCHCW